MNPATTLTHASDPSKFHRLTELDAPWPDDTRGVEAGVEGDASPAEASARFAKGGGAEARRSEEAGTAARLARSLAALDMPRDVSSSCSHRATLESPAAARVAYGRAVDSLLDVNGWSEGLSATSAEFALFDASGQRVEGRRAQAGDFIRVDLPGPAPMSWVRIESAEVGADRASLTVRPTFDPTARPRTPEVTAHFFTSAATNTFTLERRENRLRMSVEGRNETPNVGNEAGGAHLALLRRSETIGAWSGLQHRQWDELTARIVEGAR